MKIYDNIEQGTPEWLLLRKGRPSASMFKKIITSTGKLSEQSDGYIHELIAQCFVPDFDEFAGNRFTERGTEYEPEAREAFCAKFTALAVRKVAFVLADDGVCGCSPDSLIIGADGKPSAGLELKCKTPAVHVETVLDGVLPAEHRVQVHGSLAVCGLNQWHFWAYFPGMQPFHIIVQRDEFTAKVEASLAAFVARYKSAMALAVPKLKISA